MKYIIMMVWGVLLCISNVTFAASVEDYSRHSDYHSVKISPDGKHLAVLMNDEGKKKLAFLRTDNFELTFALNSSGRDQPADYYWVNNERVIVQVVQSRGRLEQPINLGEIFAVNYDGSKRKMIFGIRAQSGIAYSGYGGFLLDKLEDDKKHVLITKRLLSRDGNVLPEVTKLNVYTGKERRVKRAPISYSQFLVDNDSVPRFVVGTDKNFDTKIYYSEGKGEDWQPFESKFEGEFTPLAFSSDNKSVYALKTEENKPQGLYRYDLETEKETFLYRSEIADPTYAISSDLNEVYGLRLDEDYSSYIFIKPDTQEAKLHKALIQAFNGDSVEITSKTKDGKQMVVRVSSDRNPGSFYIFNTDTMKARFLLSSQQWIKKEQQASTEPFRIKTPDGLVLNGYLTLPIGKKQNLPTVVLPHGGPHYRDYWQFDPQAQMLANAGYAVLKVNFRGSEGYGKSFMEAGYGQWGTGIQDDITLALNYAIQTGVADKERVCIFGASFGGYSALQSAIRAPEMYKCAIGYVGVYDLPMMFDEGDIKGATWGGAYLNTTLGTDSAELIAQSPSRNVDKLNAPVLIIHGEDDQRAHFEHALALKEALDKKGHPYEWLVKDKEGHGFYNEDNILEANKAILAFLDKYIGTN
ncbi:MULTISPECIES: alpha/beta hydrolase family protein [Shewanella]|uniref:alpha/beta hydrolase family protein n=1 Tax=Shewanella TaxID=22 RepID=UPI001BC33764|nr:MULTISPECIES: S9 family peptidase [Shewanella]GIU49601.1 peptidase S9 [Shewanella sp. KT0246]